MENKWPIDPEIIMKRAFLSVKLDSLSYQQPEIAIQLLRDWGEGKKPVSQLWKEIHFYLEEEDYLPHFKTSLKKKENSFAGRGPEIPFENIKETAKKLAYFPDQLAELSYQQPEETFRLLREWSERKKSIEVLWEDVIDLLDKEKRQDA